MINYPDCIVGVNIYGAKSEQYQRLEVTVNELEATIQKGATKLSRGVEDPIED